MPILGALSGGPSCSTSVGKASWLSSSFAVGEAEGRTDRACPAVEQLAGQQQLAEALMHVARSPLVLDEVIARRLRRIALAERHRAARSR